jgi:hypothetical protein
MNLNARYDKTKIESTPVWKNLGKMFGLPLYWDDDTKLKTLNY